MKIIRTFVTLLLTFSIHVCFAQIKYLPDIKAARDLSQQSMKLFVDGKYGQAIEILRPYFPLSDDDIINLIEKTEEQMPIVKERYGNIEGFVKMGEKNAAETILREAFILQCSRLPLRFVYTYYKSKAGWLVISFTWDDEVSQELK